MRPRRTFSLALLLCLPWSLLAADAAESAGAATTPWPAVDALGRRVPLHDEVGAPRSGRYVGIFYFLWHEHAGGRRAGDKGPYDVSRILAQDPDALQKADSPLWGPIGTYHYWAEPLFGYYRATDPWVLRRHAYLLGDAGIDTLIFDATNALTYRDAYERLCEVFEEIRREGGKTPQIAFMLNTKAGETADKLHRDLYRPGRYQRLWFQWRGKPLLLCDPGQASPEVQEFFTLRRAHWPFEMVNTPYAWHWEATYPQPYGFTDDPERPEQVNVSVAQNLRVQDGRVTNMSSLNARGRSFHDGRMDTRPGAVDHGYNFQEQWSRALELAPPFVMVTGWNEWIAGRWGKPGGPVVFVDQYDQEYSRDIEPMRGGHGDNYYYQLVANVRRYKGAPPLAKASPPTTIPIRGGFGPWKDVLPEFRDHVGETVPRDFPGAAGLHYRIEGGRNDLVAFKVARDDRNVYFYARTGAPLAPRSDAAWMWLLLDADGNPSTGWEGYEWIVNRTTGPGEVAWLERHERAWSWTKVAEVEVEARGNELHLAVPRSALGLSSGSKRVSLDFKWVDGIERFGDLFELYTRGDVAPEGRFRYRYVAE